METELKLRFTTKEGYDRLLSRKRLSSMVSRNMMAIYYDTPDRRLHRERISYRVRREGERYIATIKAQGGAKDGIHQRLEWNIVQPDAIPIPPAFSLTRCSPPIRRRPSRKSWPSWETDPLKNAAAPSLSAVPPTSPAPKQ